MATTYTDNLNLQQPDFDDDALITVINNDMAIIDKAVNGVQDGLAIVANGNTHVAISAGQFVYVRNHTTLTEGLYVASSNIAANATLSTSNLTADAAGGLNALNDKIAKLFDGKTYISNLNDGTETGSYYFDNSSLNIPFPYGELIVFKNSVGVWISQFAISVLDSKFAFRACNNGVWANWEEVALNSNLKVFSLNGQDLQFAYDENDQKLYFRVNNVYKGEIALI